MSLDLSTQYGGLQLTSPVIIGACPLAAQEMIQISMISAGVGAIVLPSFFEEHFEQDALTNPKPFQKNLDIPSHGRGSTPMDSYEMPPVYVDSQSYLELVRQTSDRVSIPIIASLNGGYSNSNWSTFAPQLESAGASGIEFHLRRPEPTAHSAPQEFEDGLARAVEQIKSTVNIPVFLKIEKGQVGIGHLARRLVSKIDGLVMFGRSPSFDIALDSLHLTTRWGLTQSGSITDSLESILQVQNDCPEMPVAANGGIGNSEDLIKVLLAGASAGMIVSAVYRNKPTVIGAMLEGLKLFMDRHQLKSIAELREKGKAVISLSDERLSYVRALSSAPCESQYQASPAIASDRWGHAHPN